METLALFSQKNVDYIDAYNAICAKYHNCEQIFSYDRHFDRIEYIRRLEP